MTDKELIKRIQDALGTDEEGENLISVAQSAADAERHLARILVERLRVDLLDPNLVL